MDDSLKAHTAAKGRFTRAVNILNKAINTETLILTIERRYQELQNNWKTVQDRHDEYVNYVGESEEANEWIEHLCEVFAEAEISSDIYLRQCANKEEESNIRKQKEEIKAKEMLEKTQKAENTKTNTSRTLNRRNPEGFKLETCIAADIPHPREGFVQIIMNVLNE